MIECPISNKEFPMLKYMDIQNSLLDIQTSLALLQTLANQTARGTKTNSRTTLLIEPIRHHPVPQERGNHQQILFRQVLKVCSVQPFSTDIQNLNHLTVR